MNRQISQSSIQSSAVTVLFDGGCPLCAKEIRHYRSLPGSETIDWVDITRVPGLEEHYGVSYQQAMERFHVRDGDGRWQTGAYGFVTLWKSFAGFRWAAILLERLRLVGFTDRVYGIFAKRRLKSRCADGACEL